MPNIYVCPDCGHRYKAETEGCDECPTSFDVSGKVEDVLDRVGSDPVAAAEALEAEQEGKGRVSLVEKLEAIAGA